MSAPNGSRLLRAALLAWPREARRGDGAVMLDLAQELVDGGASPHREARTLLASGVGARVRHRARCVRSAPWVEAAPLAVGASLALVVAFAVLDVRGWGAVVRQPWAYEFDELSLRGVAVQYGLPVVVYGSALAALAMVMRRFLLAAGTIAAVGAMLGAYWHTGYHLGYVSVELGVTHQLQDGWYPVHHGTAIEVVGVPALLLVLAFVACLAGALAQRRGTLGPEPSVGRVLVCATAWLVAVLVLPRLAVLASRAIEPVLPPDPGYGLAWFPLTLMVGAILTAYSAALLLPRRAPVAGTAALLVALALLIPGVWSVLSPLIDFVDLWASFGEATAGMLWGLGVLLGAATLLSSAGRAGAAQRRSLRSAGDRPRSIA
ncbi:MAG: hypothetical protein PGN13_00510 [Patulibacter minatonensis]